MINRDKFYFRIFCVTFWVMAVGNFFLEEVLNVEINRLILVMVSDIIMLILGLVTMRSKADKLLIAVFCILTVVISIYNKIPTLYWVNGVRDYIPLLFALVIIRYFFKSPYAQEFRESFDKQLKVFLILQAFAVTEQFIRYGANDHGGGTLGNWNSGIISISILLLSFYFITKDWDGENYARSLIRNKWYIILMFPVFLNETKVSFVVMAAYFILLYPVKFKSIGKIIIAMPLMLLLFWGTYSLYILATGDSNDVASGNYINDYLTGGDDTAEMIDLAEEFSDNVEEAVEEWGYVDLPRFIKVGLIIPTLQDSRGGVLFGAGVGHFKGGTTIDRTVFAAEHQSLLFGTKMLIHFIALPFGLLGVIWFFFWIKNVLRFKTRQGPMALKIKLLLLFIVVLTFFYNEYLRYIIPSIIFYYMALSTIYKEEPKQDEKDETPSLHNSPGI